MGIDAKHSYRFQYLQSDHWKNLRLEKLSREDACCEICGFRSVSNDVHHLRYPRPLTKTKLNDLVVLCRSCHELIHEIIDTIKIGSELKSDKLFTLCRLSLKRWMNGPGESCRKSFSSKESKKVKPGDCKICGSNGHDVTPRNVIKDYVLDWDYSRWTLCFQCYFDFVIRFNPPKTSKMGWQFMEAAKKLKLELRDKKLLTESIGLTK